MDSKYMIQFVIVFEITGTDTTIAAVDVGFEMRQVASRIIDTKSRL